NWQTNRPSHSSKIIGPLMISVAPDHNRKNPDGRGRVKPLVIAATILVAIAALYWTQALLIPFALAVLLTLKRQVLMRKKSTRFLSYPLHGCRGGQSEGPVTGSPPSATRALNTSGDRSGE